MLFGHIQFRFEDDPKPACQKYSHAKIYLPQALLFTRLKVYIRTIHIRMSESTFGCIQILILGIQKFMFNYPVHIGGDYVLPNLKSCTFICFLKRGKFQPSLSITMSLFK